MENMKRVISFLLALVLVLGMVPAAPVTAGAEEVETIPETTAAETTEAPSEETVIPEEEETAQTEAATVPTEETAPMETEALETEPQETTETVPSETEDVIEEAVLTEEVTAQEEAMGAVSAPTKIIVKADKVKTYVGDPVKLGATVSPSSANQSEYKLVLVDEEGEQIEESEIAWIDAEDNTLNAYGPGTVRVCAVSTRDETVISDPVKVTFVICRILFNLAPIHEDYLLDTDGDEEMDAIRLRPGIALEVSLKYQINATGADEDWETDYMIRNLKPDVEWERSTEISKEYVTITEKAGNNSVVTLKGKSVTGTKSFTLKATDEIAGQAEVDVYIFPDPEGVEIRDGEAVLNGKTRTIDLGANDREAQTLSLTANVVPAEAAQKLTWKSSSEMVAKIEVVPDTDGQEVIVHLGGERLVGRSTLTATCEEDPSLKASLIIETVDYLQPDEMDWDLETKAVTDLVAGKSVKLKAMDITDPENPVTLTSKQVEWSLREEDKGYATISKDGLLTARSVIVGRDIEVICRAADNGENAFLTLPVTIRPKATAVYLLNENDEICNGETLIINSSDEDLGELSFAYLVALEDDGEDRGALQKVTWSSSNTAIARVDSKTGKITWRGKNGTVTITATAADGSKKSASVKLKFIAYAETLEIRCPVAYVRSGETVRMDRIIGPAAAASTQLTWSLEEGDEKYATISSSGSLKVKTIYEERTITVKAVAEGSGVEATAQVDIRPSKDGILTLMSGETCVTKTTQSLDKGSGETIELTAYFVGSEDPADVTWKYSSMLELVDDADGTAVFRLKKTGTGTITATAGGKSASVTIKGIRKTETVTIVEPENMDLSGGQSLTLKAKLYDAEGKTPSNSKVKWSLGEGDTAYASISTSGKVTAKSSYSGDPVSITVTARATDGSGKEDTCEIMIRPKATGLVIQKENVTIVSTTFDLDAPGHDTLELDALVYPLEKASQSVKWTSSSTKIAKVDQNGVVTCLGTGTVTIKAAAKDGSGKSASVKLTIRKPVYEISFEDNMDLVAGGKSLTLKPKVLAADGKKPSSSGIRWNLEGDITYATISQKGVLKTTKLTEPRTVVVTVTATDGSEVSNSWMVTIYPATTSVEILDENGAEVGKRTLSMRVGDTMDLGAISYPNKDLDVAAQSWTWSASSKSYATVDADGIVTAKKVGTVTIKAKAQDGTGKYDTVKIKILKK